MKYFALMVFFSFSLVAQDGVLVIEDDSDVKGMSEYKDNVDEKASKREVPPIIQDAQQTLLLDPVITETAREHYVDAKKAQLLIHTPDKLISKTVPLINEPGQDSQVVEVASWYSVTLSFKNTNGESLFVQRYKVDERVVDVDAGASSGEGEDAVTPYLTITNRTTIGATNLLVWLVNGKQPLSFYLKMVEKPKIYADRINYVVVDPATANSNKRLVLDTYDSLTMVLNNRKPIAEAHRIDFSDSAVSGWSHEGMMWLRTTKRLVFPTHSPTHALSSDTSSGVNVYYVAKHPIIHVVDEEGNFEALQVADEVEG